MIEAQELQESLSDAEIAQTIFKNIMLEFESKISGLREYPDRTVIYAVTKYCEDNKMFASPLCKAIVGRIISPATNLAYKLPTLYLVDSIMKNVGAPYTTFLGPQLGEAFIKTFGQLGDVDQAKLDILLCTWEERRLISVDFLTKMRSHIAMYKIERARAAAAAALSASPSVSATVVSASVVSTLSTVVPSSAVSSTVVPSSVVPTSIVSTTVVPTSYVSTSSTSTATIPSSTSPTDVQCLSYQTSRVPLPQGFGASASASSSASASASTTAASSSVSAAASATSASSSTSTSQPIAAGHIARVYKPWNDTSPTWLDYDANSVLRQIPGYENLQLLPAATVHEIIERHAQLENERSEKRPLESDSDTENLQAKRGKKSVPTEHSSAKSKVHKHPSSKVSGKQKTSKPKLAKKPPPKWCKGCGMKNHDRDACLKKKLKGWNHNLNVEFRDTKYAKSRNIIELPWPKPLRRASGGEYGNDVATEEDTYSERMASTPPSYGDSSPGSYEYQYSTPWQSSDWE